MHTHILFFFVLTVSTFGIPQNSPAIPSPSPSPSPGPSPSNVNDPCSANPGQKNPHRRFRRQFIGVQYIPGQGDSSPQPSNTPAAPAAKYVISQALIQQGSLVNGSSRELRERIDVVIANASTTADQVKCHITWNAEDSGNDKVGYQFNCESNAYCVILQQKAPGPEKGFYIYVSLPNTKDTQVAWQVKNLQTAPGWTALGSASTETLDWGNWYFNGTAPLNQNPGIPLSQFTGP